MRDDFSFSRFLILAIVAALAQTTSGAHAGDLPSFPGDGHIDRPVQSFTFAPGPDFPSERIDGPTAISDLASLEEVLGAQQMYLNKAKPATYSLDGLAQPITSQDLSRVIERLKVWQSSGRPLGDFVQAWALKGDGQGNVRFTSYFTPSIAISATRTDLFKYPLYRKPTGMGDVLPTRQEINNGALDGRGLELAWTDSLIDLYFLQVQGSGYGIDSTTGQRQLFSFGGKNGHGYVSIGKYLVDQGEIAADAISMTSIKEWFATHPRRTREVMELNPSYSFLTTDKTSVTGAAGVPITAMRTVAADSTVLPLGATILIEMPVLDADGRVASWRPRLMAVQDRGGAIKGSGRIDIYAGAGPQAEAMASHLKHFGRAWLLLPR